MSTKFYSKVVLTKQEVQNYDNVLVDYAKNRSEEDSLVKILIEDAKTFRDTNYQTLYDDIDKVIKGNLLSSEVSELFPIDTGSNEALNIMNNKASIFDVGALQVELKPTKSIEKIADSEGNDTEENFINLFNRILNENYLAKPQYKFAFSDAIKYSRGYPMAITLIGWDDNATLGNGTNFMGDITCETLPIDSFYWDPSCNDIDTAEYCYITKVLPYRKLEQFIKMLNAHNIDLLDAFYVNSNKQSSASNQGNSELASNQVLIDNGAIELITLFKKKRKLNKTTIEVFHVVGQEYVIGKQEYDISYLPFAVLKENRVPNSFTGVSSVMLALPLLKQKYFLDGILNNIALMQKNPNYLISQSSGIDGKELVDFTGSEAGKVHTVNSENPHTAVALVPTPQIQTDMLTLRQLISVDIDKTIHSTDLNNFGSKLSGSAVQNVINQATISENTSVVELERYLVRFITIMLEFLRVKLSKIKRQDYLNFRAKVVKDSQSPNGSDYEMIDITPDMFEELYADVIIDASLLRVSKQQKQQQDLLTLFQTQAQYFGKSDIITFKEIIENLNLPNKQAVVDRVLKQDEQVKTAQAVQLVQQVLQIMQDPQMQEQQVSIEEVVAMVLAQMQQGGN